MKLSVIIIITLLLLHAEYARAGKNAAERFLKRSARIVVQRRGKNRVVQNPRHPNDAQVPKKYGFSLLLANTRGLRSKRRELEIFAKSHVCGSPPELICVTETHLQECTEAITLEDYRLVGRRDRINGEGGGVAIFAHCAVSERVSIVSISEKAELLWCLVHSDRGAILVGCCYRRPDRGEIASIIVLQQELERLRHLARYVCIVGDFNAHSEAWLRFSRGESIEASMLQGLAHKFGLR